MILFVPAFIASAAIMTCFNTPTSIPKCVENISFCYDTTSLRKILDKDFARLTYQKKLLTSATTLLFRETKKVVLACNTSTNVILMPFCPRKFDVGGPYYSPTNGIGTVIQCSPEKDVITKEKFWNYTIRYEPDNALPFETVKRSRASKCTIAPSA